MLVLICLPSGIKFSTFCTPQTGVPHGTPSSLVAHSQKERTRAAADDGYLTPATKSTNSAFAANMLMPHFRDKDLKHLGRWVARTSQILVQFLPRRRMSMTGELRFPTVPCSPDGEDGPSIVTLIEVCRSFLALDLRSLMSPWGLVASASPLLPRTRDARIRQALDLG